jgi:predicted TIM-barrel fold metal-dependent hydrolase
MPPINYGEGGANQLGGVETHPGTYAIRHETLKAIVGDVAEQLARNEFRYIFLIHTHGSRAHNVALNEASEATAARHKVVMANLSGLMWADPASQGEAAALDSAFFSAAELRAFGLDQHAGYGETSEMLFVEPQLVRPMFQTLATIAGHTLDDLRRLAAAPDWPGYFSAPARATVAYGRANADLRSAQMARLVIKAAGGDDLRTQPRFPPTPRVPVIDMHMHVYSRDPRWEGRVPNPVTKQPIEAVTEDAHRRAVLEQMDRYHIVLGAISNGHGLETAVQQRWMRAAPKRFVPAIAFSAPNEVTPGWIRREYRAGRIKIIGEIAPPYVGRSAGDVAYEPFFALAEELDIPIAVHAGSAGGTATYNGFPKYRMELNRPLRLEDMLARHPRARVQLMHAGWPFTDETVALMRLHPHVYADLGVISWTQPEAEFHRHLQRLVDAGFGDRIMFGSDQMVWPEAVGMAVTAVQTATFLSDQQRRGIFCGNAARFLRLPANTCD